MKDKKQTYMILNMEFRLKRRVDTSLTWSIIISILKKGTINNDFDLIRNLVSLACYK